MDYVKGIFKKRPNRFIAEVEVNGQMEIAHVPNTENRGYLVSIYSQEANSIVYDAIINGQIKELSGYNYHQREKTIDNSRIDIYLANEVDDCCGMTFLEEPCFVEVKGVTLVVDKEARFPDAPTERGTKHLKELIKLKKEGFRTVVFFLVQHPLGEFFRPNWENDPVFSKTLNEAYEKGVEILVYKCDNSLDGIKLISEPLDFDLAEF